MVAPLAGAWIEIPLEFTVILTPGVAPLAGAWIEIEKMHVEKSRRKCRAPRGRVD